MTIDATQSTRMLQALAAMGWSIRDLAPYGVTRALGSRLRSGKCARVVPATMEAVLAAYVDLRGTRPDGVGAGIVRSHAALRGWDPPPGEPEPRADDEVDEVIIGRLLRGERVECTRAEYVEAVTILTEEGLSCREVGGLLGKSADAIQAIRSRYGISPKAYSHE